MRRHSLVGRGLVAVEQRVAPGAGVNFDHRRAERRRGLDLLADRRR